jgi:nitrogen fixation protein NifU and related proteins
MAPERLDKLDEFILGDADAAYSEVFLEHALHPHNARNLDGANGFAVAHSPDDSTMEIWLLVRDGIISEATFWTDGCGTTIACGSMMTEIVKGQSAAEALSLAPEDIASALGGLPGEGCTCAALAVNALTAAVRDYLAYKNEPWRRKYSQPGTR